MMKSVKEFPYFSRWSSRCGCPLWLLWLGPASPLWLHREDQQPRLGAVAEALPGVATTGKLTRATGVTTGSHNGRTRGGPQREKYGKVRNGGNMIGLTWWKQVISVKFTPYQVWRGMCMHPGSRLTTRQFIANSLLLCLFKTLFYSGFTGWGTPFYTQIYGALGGHPSAFHIGKPIL